MVLLLAWAAGCTPPDRPPRLPDPVPEELLAYLRPDTVRTRRVAPGVWYRYLWSPEGPWAVHVVEADLRRCELGLEVARAPDRPGAGGGHGRISELPEASPATGALVAVNGDFFTPEGMPLGPELTDAGLRTARERPALSWRPGDRLWVGTARLEGDSALSVGWRVPLVGGRSDPGGRDTSRVRARGRRGDVLGGYPELLDGGKRVGDLLVSENPGFAGSRHPRTAVGYRPEGRRLWLVVVDGRQGGYSLGMTLPELTRLLEILGATEALNLDGGGSSVMVVRGRPWSRPSDDGGERPVVNALVLREDPSAYCGR